MNDSDLVRIALASPEAFSEIITKYRPLLLRYIHRLGCTDLHTAEDILQDVFISVYKNLNNYNTDLSFSSWIYRITHNHTISVFRKQSHTISLSFDDTDYETVTEHITQKTTLDTSDIEIIHRAINTLPPQYKEVIVLYYLEEKNYEEIADILQKPPGTIATLLHRAKNHIKKIVPLQHTHPSYGTR